MEGFSDVSPRYPSQTKKISLMTFGNLRSHHHQMFGVGTCITQIIISIETTQNMQNLTASLNSFGSFPWLSLFPINSKPCSEISVGHPGNCLMVFVW
jgi:hypothetical protein